MEEAAAFWDTHSVADYADELEEVTDIQFVRAEPKKAITVRLGAGTLAALTAAARQRGIGPSTLARMMIMESLRASHETTASPARQHGAGQ